MGARSGPCPSCGGPIELKLASSAALVCPWCRFSVVRTDRDLRAIGKIADLVPTAAVMAVGDHGTVGKQGFRVGGRLQLDHGRGPWDEWYVELSNGKWAWLAKAQGNWYMTSPIEVSGLPPFEQMNPGSGGELPGAPGIAFTVAERGGSILLSAEGELPFPAVPNESGRYVDLTGPNGSFATIDYGDGSEPPKLFVGRLLRHDEIQFKEGGLGPRPEQRIDLGKLACPGCGGPVAIHAPDSTERVACPSCSGLLDYQAGNLKYLEQLSQPLVETYLPIGTRGKLEGLDCLVIGIMDRYCVVEGDAYYWREYLLHTPKGFRWLLLSDGHYTFIEPLHPGDVSSNGYTASYQGKSHKRFSEVTAIVSGVVGEFYWKVKVGDQALAIDYIAPPSMLSEERSDGEVNWSRGQYTPPKEIWRAFGLKGSPPRPSGVAPAQPNPSSVGWSVATGVVLIAALIFVAIFADFGRTKTVLVDGPLTVPMQTASQMEANMNAVAATPGATAPDTAIYTPTFIVPRGPTTLSFNILTNVQNAWAGVACALVNEDTGEVRELDVGTEYYSGITDGESWSEGSASDTTYLDRVDAGRYVLRLQPMWEPATGVGFSASMSAPPTMNLRVTAGDRSLACFLCSFALLLLPLGISIGRSASFESRRWQNSNLV